MKLLAKLLLVAYLLVLLWLVLFKFSTTLPSAFEQARSLNLTPFAYYSQAIAREIIYNFLVFIPFGLFLGVTFIRTSFLDKLALILLFSFSAEVIQFVFAIGIADITDVISNTSGGLLGLILYELFRRCFDNDKLDNFITATGTILLAALISILGILFSQGIRFRGPPPDGPPRIRSNMR